jgi:hypothetical protein
MVVLPLPAYPFNINTGTGPSIKATSLVKAVSWPLLRFKCLK